MMRMEGGRVFGFDYHSFDGIIVIIYDKYNFSTTKMLACWKIQDERENAGILLLLVAHRAVCCVRTNFLGSNGSRAATPTLKRHERKKTDKT